MQTYLLHYQKKSLYDQNTETSFVWYEFTNWWTSIIDILYIPCGYINIWYIHLTKTSILISFCVLYIIVILQNIENAFNFFISIFLGRGRFIYTFALNFVWGVFPLLDISQIFHPLTSYKNISYLWNKSTAWIDY